MIKPEQVPDEVSIALIDGLAKGRAKDAIAAALAAWPGMRMMVDIDTGDDAAIKLPLNTQENEQ